MLDFLKFPLRQTIGFYLEDLETPIGRSINLGITGLVLLSTAVFVAETYPLTPLLRADLKLLDTGILWVFAIEYTLRLWCAEDKIRHLFKLSSILDLIVLLPFLLGSFDIRFLRILRWFRILRLVRFVEGNTFFGYISREDGVIFSRIIFTLCVIIFVYSGLIYQVEHPINPQAFATFFDAVYFSVATMTTVGFGDVTPLSELGRLLTVLMILTGVALIPWQIGDLIKRLVKTSNQVAILCSGCGLTFHDADASFCKLCGTKLMTISEKSHN
jgi:voltage-gated potassium channel